MTGKAGFWERSLYNELTRREEAVGMLLAAVTPIGVVAILWAVS